MNNPPKAPAGAESNATAMPLARVASYTLGKTASLMGQETLEAVGQPDGSVLWAVRRMGGSCLNKRGEWEYEPQPSSRTAAFFKRCRWPTPEAAYQVWEKTHAPKSAPPKHL